MKASMAECFRVNYPDTFIVLDATELCTEIRSCLALQSQLYSSYKSRTTLKDLIGISPNGSIYFVSELGSGSISDRKLVIKSVMFCLSKNVYHHIHKQCYLSTFFFLLSDFLHLLLVDSHDCFTSIMFCLSQCKKNSNHCIHKHCSLSIPVFLTSFVFADSDSWFTSIMFSFKKLFSSLSRALLLPFTFLFQWHLRFFGKRFVISWQTVGTLFCSLLYRKY